VVRNASAHLPGQEILILTRSRGIQDRPVAETPIAVFDFMKAVANCDRFFLQTANRDLEQTWTVQAA
jgi:hypothetical protein